MLLLYKEKFKKKFVLPTLLKVSWQIVQPYVYTMYILLEGRTLIKEKIRDI